MQSKRILVLLVMIFIASFLISSCAIFGKKGKGEVYDKGKEGQWVYSAQKPSPTGDQKRATTYSKRPYTGQEGEEVALAGAETQPSIKPYLLGRLKYKVVVAEFQDNTKQARKGLGSLVAQQLGNQLEESGAVIVVEMEQVKKSLGGGDVSSLSTTASLWKLRTLLGVQGVVTGKIQSVLIGTGTQGKAEEAVAITKMDVVLLDTETGNVIRSIKGENPIYTSRAVGELNEGKALSNAINFSLQGVADGIIRGLAGLEWTTSVATVESDKLYLNAGKSTGLKVGDELEIYNPGRQIKNPTTGVTLGRLPGTVQGKVKISQLFGLDAAEAKIVSGGHITTGDMVRLAK